MVLNIFLTVLFVPSKGYMAAAWITVFSEGLVLFVSGFMLYRLFRSRDTIAKLSLAP
jgi:O-antigen/teichoic acid export membrane protein